jgi:hypothetical protein
MPIALTTNPISRTFQGLAAGDSRTGQWPYLGSGQKLPSLEKGPFLAKKLCFGLGADLLAVEAVFSEPFSSRFPANREKYRELCQSASEYLTT